MVCVGEITVVGFSEIKTDVSLTKNASWVSQPDD